MSSSPNAIGASSRRPNPTGKSYKVHKEIHPEVKPKWRREDAVASAAESFSKGLSAVQKMEAGQPEPDPATLKPKGKSKTIIDTSKLVDEVSPKTHRDAIIARETEKFVHGSGIAQLIGEKDRASPARRPEGIAKIVRRDVHPDVPPRVPGAETRAVESEKFAVDTAHSPLSRIGEADQPNTVRKKVVAGRKNQPNLITPEQAPHVIKRRTVHADQVMATYEAAIVEREAARQAAADAQSKDCTLLQKFSPSEAVPYRSGVKQIAHGDPRGNLPAGAAIPGFPGLGSKSGEVATGRTHYFDPNSNNSSAPRNNAPSRGANHIVGSDGVEDLSASRTVHKAKYDKTLDSKDFAVCMTHPDHKPFDQKAKDWKSKKLEHLSNEAPLWWPKSIGGENDGGKRRGEGRLGAAKITATNNNNETSAVNNSSHNNESKIGTGKNVRSNLPSNVDSLAAKPGRRNAPRTDPSTPSWWPTESK